MSENETPADQVRSVMAKNLEQAHGAIANYFQFVEKGISASPLGATARKRFAGCLAHSDRVQKQLQALTEQSEYLGDAASKKASEVVNIPIK